MIAVYRIRHVNSGAELLGQVIDCEAGILEVVCWYRNDGKRFRLRFREADGWQLLDPRYGGGRGGWRLEKNSEIAVAELPAEEVDEDVGPRRELMN